MVLTVINRTVIQVKTHGQTMYRYINGPEGLDGLIKRIENLEKECESPVSIDLTCTESISDISHTESEFSTPDSSFEVYASPTSEVTRWNQSEVHSSSPITHCPMLPRDVTQSHRCTTKDIRPSIDITFEDVVAAKILVKMKNAKCIQSHRYTTKDIMPSINITFEDVVAAKILVKMKNVKCNTI